MKTTKKLLSLVIALLLLSGCTTTGGGNSTVTPEFVQGIVDESLGIFVTIELRKNPLTFVAFSKARIALDDLVANKNWNLGAFAEALAAADVGSLSKTDFQLYIVPGISLVNLFLSGKQIDLRSSVYAQAVITGAASALDRTVH